MSELVRGIGDVGRGLAFLRQHGRLWKWVVAPALITLVLLAGAILGVVAVANPLVAWVAERLPDVLQTAASWVIGLVVVGGLAIAALLAFVTIAGVVAGPFNELLSEQVEEILTGTPAPGFSLGAFVRGAVRGLAHGVRRLVVALLGIALVFGLGFVPVVGTIAAAAIGLYIAGRAAAYDCYDAVLSRRELSYRAKLAHLAAHRGRSLGLGVSVAGMLLVPGLNLIALGVGAVGATLAERSQPGERR